MRKYNQICIWVFYSILINHLEISRIHPTYTLVEPYYLQRKNIYHFDLYRLQDPEELELIGVRDYFENSICLIEWPERGKGYLPYADLHINFSILQVGRLVKIIAETEAGEKVIKNFGAIYIDISGQ